jgi:dCTP deaminase
MAGMGEVGTSIKRFKGSRCVILTDREIKIALERGLIQIDPVPDGEAAFSSTAVDLTLDSTLIMFNDPVQGIEQAIDPSLASASDILQGLTTRRKIPKDGFLIQPKTLVLAWTKEYVGLNIGTRIAARVEGKSSLARFGLGVHVTAPTIHAGFTGQIQLEMVNHGAAPIRLRTGMRICQLIFETTLGTPERGYKGQFAGQMAKTTKKKAA